MAEAGSFPTTVIGRRRYVASVSDADGRKWTIAVEGRNQDDARRAVEPMLRTGETLHGIVEQ
ncbi:MAG TPA: hypothetical protein VNJ51_07150 [Candidatus Dormibacteraeota bacterium]|nr:hypothetical protein [Candidatus Dormibacteraeota bacterium]